MEQLFALIIGAIFVVGLLTVVAVPLAILRGFVLTKLWAWFVVPFFGLPALSIPLAIGISLLIGFLAQSPTAKDVESGDWKKSFSISILSPLITLFIGWIVTFWL